MQRSSELDVKNNILQLDIEGKFVEQRPEEGSAELELMIYKIFIIIRYSGKLFLIVI